MTTYFYSNINESLWELSLRRLDGQQINHQIFFKSSDMNCLAINYHLLKEQEAHGPHRSPEKTVQIIKS